MSNYFSYYQKCNKNRCNCYQFFEISLTNYDDNGRCVLDEAHKSLYSFLCPLCKMVYFLNFETAANQNCIKYLKGPQFVINLRKQIKDNRMQWKEKRRKVRSIR